MKKSQPLRRKINFKIATVFLFLLQLMYKTTRRSFLCGFIGPVCASWCFTVDAVLADMIHSLRYLSTWTKRITANLEKSKFHEPEWEFHGFNVRSQAAWDRQIHLVQHLWSKQIYQIITYHFHMPNHHPDDDELSDKWQTLSSCLTCATVCLDILSASSEVSGYTVASWGVSL